MSRDPPFAFNPRLPVIGRRFVSLRMPHPLHCCGIAALTLACTIQSDRSVAAEESQNVAASNQWRDVGWPLVQQYCLDCHNVDNAEGELDLSGFASLDAMEGGGGAMQRVLEMVRFGAMPPDDADLPSEAERKTLVHSLDAALFSVSCDLRPRAGKVTARRLNRVEYNHSIRDLFGIDLRPADAFPSDEVGGGFDNNGDVLSLSPMLIEKYIDAAESVSSQVLIDPATIPKADLSVASDQLTVFGDSRTGSFFGRFLEPGGFVCVEFEVPFDGEYRVRLYGGTSDNDSGSAPFALYDRGGTLLATTELKYFGGSGRSDREEVRLKLTKGAHQIFIVPASDLQDPKPGKTRSERIAAIDDAELAEAKAARKSPLKPDSKFDRSSYPMMVRKLSVEGPTSPPKEAFPRSQGRLVRRTAKRKGNRWSGVEEAAIECLQPLMRRAFREPVSKDEVRPYAALVREATDRDESYYRGLQIAVSAVLMSPRFLFRVETPPEGESLSTEQDVRLTPHQLATRLSYLLWSSLPDEALLSDADKNRLDDKRLAEHIDRMLRDPKAQTLASQFAAQWFGLRNLIEHEVDEDLFPGFDAALKGAMQEETHRVFMHVARENRPVAELLTADYSFVNERLAAHYGIDSVKGDQFQQVSLAGTPRRGILSHASVLTLTSNPARTSPVKRGKWVLENILGTPPPEPPAGVPELEETDTAAKDATLRQQLELHRTDPSCAACHRVMDQLGFGLEQFDAIGQFRTKDGHSDVDASGEMPGGRTFNGAAELSELLGKSERTAFAKAATERLLTFAIGRELTPSDRCSVDEIVQRTAGSDHRFGDLLREVVLSRPFQYYEWSGPAPSPEVASDPDKPAAKDTAQSP